MVEEVTVGQRKLEEMRSEGGKKEETFGEPRVHLSVKNMVSGREWGWTKKEGAEPGKHVSEVKAGILPCGENH